jgi:hypothetical protein
VLNQYVEVKLIGCVLLTVEDKFVELKLNSIFLFNYNIFFHFEERTLEYCINELMDWLSFKLNLNLILLNMERSSKNDLETFTFFYFLTFTFFFFLGRSTFVRAADIFRSKISPNSLFCLFFVARSRSHLDDQLAI